MKYYAGIGSRQTPSEMYKYISILTNILQRKKYILRSGGAKGADTMFEETLDTHLKSKYHNRKEIFYSRNAEPWSFVEVLQHFPKDRNKDEFNYWKPYVKGLMARNMMQILGKNKKHLVEFVVCWTPSMKYNMSDCGGTGYAIRCAQAYNIPIYNFNSYIEPKYLIYDIIDKHLTTGVKSV